jgi:hypothetical protein
MTATVGRSASVAVGAAGALAAAVLIYHRRGEKGGGWKCGHHTQEGSEEGEGNLRRNEMDIR